MKGFYLSASSIIDLDSSGSNSSCYGMIFYRWRRILNVKPSVGNLNLDNDNGDDNKPLTLIVDASGLTVTTKRRLYRTEMDSQEKRVYQAAYCSRC